MPNSPDPATSGTHDLNPGQLAPARRARPPNPQIEAGDAVRVPLRADSGDKARKRESRLGLRNIFGRHRGGSDADREPASPRDATHKPGGIRASLAEISWSYGLHHSQGHRSELSLSSFPKSPPAGQNLKHKKSESGVRPQLNPEGIAAWSPPPLFKAYPQAIKHASLAACTASVDVVLRLHNHKSSGSLGGLLSPSAPDIPEEVMDDKSKRRHRRNLSGSASKFEWTTKIFILVTSGCLLQYAGEGSFDRLPEKVLQLGKDSAAFASDAIPGRHWVLQVSSVAEPERVPSSHSSLRARLPFRGQERRHSSTFLMVFESAEDMEGWMVTLRQNIEHLGGRKVLSETGKPVVWGQNPQLRSQTSQRTLVVKDPNRFSRVLSPDRPWNQSVASSSPDNHLEAAQEEHVHEQAFDDNSTASFVSHDGRQLDGLRDSTTSLSYRSSSQRTMVTSVGSSPACSPIRDSFGELDSPMLERSPFEEQPQPRLRPNAMAIIDRRQSLQAMNHVFEIRVATAQSIPTSSTLAGSGRPESIVSPTTAPQPFGVPHNAVKRHFFAKTSVGMPIQTTTSSPLGRMSARRPPPSALTINPRPLSLVEDQPSPALSSPSRSGTGTDSAGSPLSAVPIVPSLVPSPLRSENEASQCEAKDGSTRDLARDSGVSTQDHGPEIVVFAERRPSSEPLEGDAERHSLLPSLKVLHALDTPRSRSSLGVYDGICSTAKPTVRVRRLSLTSPQHGERLSLLLSPPPIRPSLPQGVHAPSLRPGPKSSQHLGLAPHSESLAQRRSMSHLTDGPPPAPPPNKALPPIPQKARMTVVPPPGFF